MGAIGKPPEMFQQQGNDLSPSVTCTQDPLNNDVSEISRELKVLAKELNVPVIALSQLNRDIEQRKPPVPILSDLRDSGSLEQDADIVMFIYRGDIFEPNEPVGAQLLVAKQRNGPTGDVPLTFNASFVRFEERVERRPIPGGLR